MENVSLNENMGELAVGLYDVPYSPKATVLYLNPLKSNAAIFGGSASGKTTMVKNLLARMNEEEPYASVENTYILDFADNIGKYALLGRVCACFNNSNDENIKRIFRTVEQRFTENSRILNGESYIGYMKNNPDKPLPHITLIIENVTAFLSEDRFAMYHDILTKLARDGLSKGVSVILTANDITGALNRIMVHFGRKFAFEMQKDKYLEIFNTKVDEPMKTAGRGITIVDSEPREFQAYRPFRTEAELDALIARSAKAEVAKLKSFPAELTEELLPEFCEQPELLESEVLLGLDYYEHTPIALDLEQTTTVAIYGKKQFGKTNLLRLIMRGAFERYPDAQYVFVDDAREQLKEFYDRLCEAGCKKLRYYGQFKECKAFLKEIKGELEQNGSSDADAPVFIILHGKEMFKPEARSDGFILANLITKSENTNIHFIFADVPKITDKIVYDEFNGLVNVAFLLDSIGDFLAERGSSSVFNGMDEKEMKREYARCDVGDGYYYEVGREDLHKIKIIKSKTS